MAAESVMLQFGHGGEAVEMRKPMSAEKTKKPLQFGHGGEAVEI